MNIIKKSLLVVVMLLLPTLLVAQKPQSKEQVRLTVQLKMIQAHRLQKEGKTEQAKLLVKDSIDIILFAMRNERAEPWMREGIRIAMQSNKTSEIEMKRIMLEVERYIPKKRGLSLREKLNSLTDTFATRELARDRRHAVEDGRFSVVLGKRGVGYHPIITWLPQGTTMSAGPVIVSPDRRYVRVGISYSNMSIGAVHTFNFSTGKYQTLESK